MATRSSSKKLGIEVTGGVVLCRRALDSLLTRRYRSIKL